MQERKALRECISKKDPDMTILQGKKFLWDAN